MKSKILSMDVNVIDIKMAVDKIAGLALKKRGSYVCVSNVHMCMEVFDSQTFKKVVNGADLILPDGRPLSWAQKLLGHSTATQVRGQDIMNALCVMSCNEELRIGLYGGQSKMVLDAVQTKLKLHYPTIKLTYAFSPPFRPLAQEEDDDVIAQINSVGVDILFVGIGCPKQEYWMAEHREQLGCVMLGVGAAFDFISGEKKHAPHWMQRAGLEWFFRLCAEPKRLWKRYLQQNPRFVFYFGLQLLKSKLNRR